MNSARGITLVRSFPNLLPSAGVWERTCLRNSIAAFLPLAALSLTACSSAVTADKMSQVKPAMTPAQVETILGRPASIDQSETADQALSGEVDHYPAPTGEGRVVYINKAVFKSEFVPGAKS